jgi:hypothetical protein
MPVGTPRTWATNDKITATMWDGETRDQSNALIGRASAMLVKTVMHQFGTMDDSYSELVPSRSLVNVLFDQVAYDYAYDGSKMAYGSTLMCNIPGWYQITGAHYWATTGYFGTATPLVGTRNLCFQVNSSGRMYSVFGRIMSPIVSDAVRYAWIQEPALSPAGSTALVQPVRATDEVYLARGDYVEMFAGQDSGNSLNDYVINQDVAAAGQSAAGFSTFMSATWIRGA